MPSNTEPLMPSPDGAPTPKGAAHIKCSACGVSYTPGAECGEMVVCPVCDNVQPGGSRTKLPVLELPVLTAPIADGTLDEASQAVLMRSFYNTVVDMPHVAQHDFPDKAHITESSLIPVTVVTITTQWEKRWVERGTRPYAHERIWEHPVTQESIDLATYAPPYESTGGPKQYEMPESYATQVCTTCNGEKRHSCHRCWERGRVECVACHGTKRRECPTCNGTGQATQYNYSMEETKCIVCNGTGVPLDPLGLNKNLTGTARRSYMDRCQRCYGRGFRMEKVSHPFKVPCGGCAHTGKVFCADCDEKGLVRCEKCDATGNTQCKTCNATGQELSFLVWHRKELKETRTAPAIFTEYVIADLDARAALVKRGTPSFLNLSRDWGSVYDNAGSHNEMVTDVSSRFSDRRVTDTIESVIEQIRNQHHAKEQFLRSSVDESAVLVPGRLAIKVLQSQVLGARYSYEGKSYEVWGFGRSAQIEPTPTPLTEKAAHIISQSLELWSRGEQEEAIRRLRWANDIAKRDPCVAKRIKATAIPEGLVKGARAQANDILLRATGKRIVDTAKAVTGWVRNAFRRS